MSEAARRLLEVLRQRRAYLPEHAITDAEIAEAVGVHVRVVIDAALELLSHGYLVLAGGRGRWLLDARESLADPDRSGVREQDAAALSRLAVAYIDGLMRRGRRVMLRAREARAALRQFEVESRRQGMLFDGAASPAGGQWR
ncbi:MAG: hypothetical protein LC135_01815 [Phycisphaerae bacterium]|nr:hypothetical protein [Phycisphaerae bacterium]MCZ2398590.1 hypothetical protein [Phycisphaerae bacterium]